MQWSKNTCRPLATEIYNGIKQRRLDLPRDKAMTVRHICGDLWNSLDNAEKRFAGRFVSACVRKGLLGLERTRKDSCNHWRYHLQ